MGYHKNGALNGVVFYVSEIQPTKYVWLLLVIPFLGKVILFGKG